MGGAMSSVIIAGNTSGTITLAAPAVSGSSVLTLPVATDTLVGKATTDTLTNKTLTNPLISSGSVFRKNALINGDFQIWQEGTSFAAIVSNTYTADLWNYVKVGTMVHTVSQSSDVPTIAEAGRKIPYSLLIDCTTADAAIAAGDICQIRSFVEGYNFVNIAGVGLCLQFWHKHTKTGIYCVNFSNSIADRSFVREYTQDVSDTWEFASVLVDASPTAGTWNYTTGLGLIVGFALACGTNFQGTAGTWNSADDRATSNQVNACDNVANNFRLAGVQLEKSSVATEFEAMNIQDVLARCQRYFEKSYNLADAPGTVTQIGTTYLVYAATYSVASSPMRFSVHKRITPTMTGYTRDTGVAGSWNDTVAGVQTVTFSGFGQGGGGYVVLAAGNDGYYGHWAANARF